MVDQARIGLPAAGDAARVAAVHKEIPGQRRWLHLLCEPRSPVAASYRVLRYRIKKQGDPHVIAVTSPRNDEGKTTTAVNLAMALAEDGRERVLLIEANLRMPKLAELMGFVPPVCFKKQLDRSLETPNAPWEVVATFWDNLHVLAVDPSRPKDGTLVAHAFKSAIRQLLGHPYAYIVVDCPPVLGSADVNIISEAVDGLLFTTLSGRSRTSDLRQAEEHLRPAHVLGTVLVGAI